MMQAKASGAQQAWALATIALALLATRPCLAQVDDRSGLASVASSVLPMPLVSIHANASVGVGSLGALTGAARTSGSAVYWFLPNAGVGVEGEAAYQAGMNFDGPNASHGHYALSAALALRAPRHAPLLFMPTLGLYYGGEDWEPPSIGIRFGVRLGYLAQLGPAEVGPMLALDVTAGAPRPGVMATLGIQAGFTISRKPRAVTSARSISPATRTRGSQVAPL